MKELFNLFAAFFRVGLFTIGGGYAMLPMLRRETIERYGWVTEEDLLEAYALSQCLPGVIATNSAAYIGKKTRGAAGALAAVLGVVTPSIIIIVLIAQVIRTAMTLEPVIRAFAGIRAAVAAMVLAALVTLFKNGIKNRLQLVVFTAAFILAGLFDVSPVIIVFIATAAGLCLGFADKNTESEGDAK